MASTTVTKVDVVELTKYGFKDGKGAYVGWSKNLKDTEKVPVVPGRSFEMELYVADSGKQYVNKILKQLDVAAMTSVVAPNKAVVKEPVKASVAPSSNGTAMSKEEWADKDRRISRQGCIQAAVQAVAHLMATEDDLFTTAKELADKMLGYVNEGK